MNEFNVAIDTELGEKAIEIINEFLKSESADISRTQISGLLQIARSEPIRVYAFIENKIKKLENKGENQTSIAKFWTMLKLICSNNNNPNEWTLFQYYQKTNTDKQHQAPDQVKLKNNYTEWIKLCYPLFFQRLCAHYLYKSALKKGR